MKALAVDVGGSHVACAVVEDDRVLASEVLSQASLGLGGMLPAIAAALQRTLGLARVAANECAGLAFAFCGLVDARTGRVLSTNGKHEDAPGLDLPAWCREAFALPLRLENDARLALLGERSAGAGRGCDDLVMMTLGTGIGGAAMIEGRLLRGRHFQAGVLGGHLVVDFEGRPCSCGAVGCAEAEASTWSLAEICRSRPGFASSALRRCQPLDLRGLFACADAGDGVAVEVRERCLRVWSAAAVSMVHAWDPELLLLGGGVMRNAAQVLPAIEQHVQRHAWTPWGKVRVRAAALGEQAALLGAVPLLGGA